MPDIIIVIILVLILFFAAKSSVAHFKGEGACCGGGGSKLKLLKPQKLDKVITEKTVYIEGMTCDHCAGRIHNALNSIEGINAKVIRSKDKAIIKYGKTVDDEKIRTVITELGYKVTSID